MPTTEDIREALARNDADEAEALINVVQSKHHGRGLSGHDQQIFAGQIERIRQTTVAPEPAPEPEEAPKRGKGGRFVSKTARQLKVNQDTGDLESA